MLFYTFLWWVLFFWCFSMFFFFFSGAICLDMLIFFFLMCSYIYSWEEFCFSVVMYAGFQFSIFYGLGFVEEVCVCLFIIFSLLRLLFLKRKSNGCFFFFIILHMLLFFFFFSKKTQLLDFIFWWQTISPLCSMNWRQRKSTFVFWIYEKQVYTQQFWVVKLFLLPNGS